VVKNKIQKQKKINQQLGVLCALARNLAQPHFNILSPPLLRLRTFGSIRLSGKKIKSRSKRKSIKQQFCVFCVPAR